MSKRRSIASPSEDYPSGNKDDEAQHSWIVPGGLGRFQAGGQNLFFDKITGTPNASSQERYEMPNWFVSSGKTDGFDDGSAVEAKVDQALARISDLEEKIELTLEAKVKDLDDRTSAAQDNMRDIGEKEKAAAKRLGGIRKRIKDLDSQIRNDKLQAIQVLALFVAFFTFVSVEFQFFTTLKSFIAVVSLSLILLGGLLCFVCMSYLGLSYYTREGVSPKLGFNRVYAWAMSIVSVVCIIGGVYIASFEVERLEADVRMRCQDLNSRVLRELEKPESKNLEFLMQDYATKCYSEQSINPAAIK